MGSLNSFCELISEMNTHMHTTTNLIFYDFRSALRNVFILEFHPTLAVASKVPQALKYALQVCPLYIDQQTWPLSGFPFEMFYLRINL